MDEALKAISGKFHIQTDKAARGAIACYADRVDFASIGRELKAMGFRLCAEWATDETRSGKGFSVFAAYHKDSDYLVVSAALPAVDPEFPSLAGYFHAAWRFERQIRSLMGIDPAGNPDKRPWIMHEDWPPDEHPLRKSFDLNARIGRVKGDYHWVQAEGHGVMEIPVGPVHAGIIEPGHFRFQAIGEDIINLETRFGYVHKAIEKRFEALGWHDAVRLSGRVSGDSTVAHAVAFCMASERASNTEPSLRAMYVRAVMIEIERIANHLGDIGAICNDTGFAFLHYQFSALRERVLRTNKEVFGHRLMMDRVSLGGVTVDVQRQSAERIRHGLDALEREFERLVPIYEDNPSLEDRVYDTGVLTPEIAGTIGVVGYVARSSGLAVDVRLQTPFPPYNRHVPARVCLSSGDVHARAWVRIEEVRDSIRLVRAMLDDMPGGPLAAEWREPPPGASGFSAVEGWRGEIIYWVRSGAEGSIDRCMVRDPSSVNWLAIEQAIKGNIVPDFPLCNKSFNQSYSGHDL
jgi:Ni,Fe-hydrogenase III large subunit/Ni,Fe-hydrogenase III component G